MRPRERSDRTRLWYNNYDEHGRWKSDTRFILPEIDSVLKKIVRRGLMLVSASALNSALRQIGYEHSRMSRTLKQNRLRLLVDDYKKCMAATSKDGGGGGSHIASIRAVSLSRK